MTQAQQIDLAALVGAHQAGVWRYLRLLGCDHALADDLTQETFLTLIRSASFEERSPHETAAWLRKTAKSVFLKALRRTHRTRVEPLDDMEAADTAWEALQRSDRSDADIRDALGHCLDALGKRARRAIELHYQQQLPGESIASELGMRHGAIRVLLHRTRKTLRDCVQRRMDRE